jgi:hypothetical protein
MAYFLASAERTDLSGSQWSVMLIGLAVLVGVTVLTAVPILMARRRGHRRAEAVTVGAIFWGVLSAGGVLWYCLAKLQWTKAYQTDLMTGYLDPRDMSGEPAFPWRLWVVLAVLFCALLAWAFSAKATGRTPPK